MPKDFWWIAMKQLGLHVFSGEHEKLWNITSLSFMGHTTLHQPHALFPSGIFCLVDWGSECPIFVIVVNVFTGT
jgi:hypothetical protein